MTLEIAVQGSEMHGSLMDWTPSMLLLGHSYFTPTDTERFARWPEIVWPQWETGPRKTEQWEVASVDKTARTGAEPGAHKQAGERSHTEAETQQTDSIEPAQSSRNKYDLCEVMHAEIIHLFGENWAL